MTESPLAPDQPSATITPTPDPAPRSRRSLLAAALGGVAGLVAGRLGSPDRAAAAAGSPIVLGSANDAGTANTTIKTTSAGMALQMNNLGTGVGGAMLSTGGVGLAAATSSKDKYGGSFSNHGTTPGTGAAVLATGKQNTGLIATTASATRYAIEATNGSGTAIHAKGSVTGIYVTAVDTGIYATASTTGIYATASHTAVTAHCPNGQGVVAFGMSVGVQGFTNWASGTGVWGYATAASSDAWGVYGTAEAGAGVGGYSTSGVGVYGESATGLAIYGVGNAEVSGTLTKGAGAFRIDHPLDPASKYLQHSFVESPDMKNVYDGVVELHAKGEASVQLPAWFEALNSDYRYQLTPLGKAAPELHVKAEVKKNRFSLAGGDPGQRVSWQVTGIRRDAYAEAHRIEVEVTKTGKEQGRYLHPKEHGKPESKGIAKLHQKKVR